MTFQDKFTGPLFTDTQTVTARCPYHTEPTPADLRVEWTYLPMNTDRQPERRTMVDTVCEGHYEMHKASLRAASTVQPVSVTRITR